MANYYHQLGRPKFLGDGSNIVTEETIFRYEGRDRISIRGINDDEYSLIRGMENFFTDEERQYLKGKDILLTTRVENDRPYIVIPGFIKRLKYKTDPESLIQITEIEELPGIFQPGLEALLKSHGIDINIEFWEGLSS